MNIQLLNTFKKHENDLVFEAESENGTLFDVSIDKAEIAEFSGIEGKNLDLVQGSDDIMEAARQMYEGWSERGASYSIEVVRQEKLIFKRSVSKAN